MFAGDADFVICRALQFAPEHHVLDFRCIQQATAFCFDLRVQKFLSSFPRCRAVSSLSQVKCCKGFGPIARFSGLPSRAALAGGLQDGNKASKETFSR